MATSNQQPSTPDEQERMQLGKSGKLFRLEVLYFIGESVKKIDIANRKWTEVLEFRGNIYEIGLFVPIDPGHWVIVSPADIKRVDVYRQNGYL